MKKLRVLAVDNDPAVLETTSELLRASGHCVDAFLDSRDALDELKLHGLAFNLVVTDLEMGANPDGFTVIREAQKANPRIKTLLVTGILLGGDMVVERARELGAEVLFKPLTLELLRDAVERAVRGT